MKKESLEVRAAGYDEDFYIWTQRTAELICQGRFGEIDREHVAEELSDMGKRDRREVRSRLFVLIAHLLKREVQPEKQSNSWLATIAEQRRQLSYIFEDSPSLRAFATRELEGIYEDARVQAAAEMEVPVDGIPAVPSQGLKEELSALLTG